MGLKVALLSGRTSLILSLSLTQQLEDTRTSFPGLLLLYSVRICKFKVRLRLMWGFSSLRQRNQAGVFKSYIIFSMTFSCVIMTVTQNGSEGRSFALNPLKWMCQMHTAKTSLCDLYVSSLLEWIIKQKEDCGVHYQYGQEGNYRLFQYKIIHLFFNSTEYCINSDKRKYTSLESSINILRDMAQWKIKCWESQDHQCFSLIFQIEMLIHHRQHKHTITTDVYNLIQSNSRQGANKEQTASRG